MKLLLKIFVGCTLVLFLGFTGVLYLSLQSYPHIGQTHFIDARVAKETQQLVKRVKSSFKTLDKPTRLTISKQELQSLSALANRALPQVRSDLELSQTALNIDLAVELPITISAKYLNISTVIFPSKVGIDIGKVSVGDITIEGRWILQSLAWAINYYVQAELGTNLLAMVRSVEIKNETLVFDYQVPSEFNSLNKVKESGILALTEHFSLFGNVDSIRSYYLLLVDFSQKNQTEQRLSKYLGFMFQIAKNRTLIDDERSAITENKEALMALALYFGSNKFEFLVGKMPKLSLVQKQQRIDKRESVILNNRNDLQKHFIYSIALQLFGNTQTSDAIGEMKEFLDANKGGGGFSFADLTADRAGTRIAMIATKTEMTATALQTLFSARLDEKDIMPKILGLPEGLSQQNFEKNYRDINSVAYKDMLAKIDVRLAMIKAYQIR